MPMAGQIWARCLGRASACSGRSSAPPTRSRPITVAEADCARSNPAGGALVRPGKGGLTWDNANHTGGLGPATVRHRKPLPARRLRARRDRSDPGRDRVPVRRCRGSADARDAGQLTPSRLRATISRLPQQPQSAKVVPNALSYLMITLKS